MYVQIQFILITSTSYGPALPVYLSPKSLHSFNPECGCVVALEHANFNLTEITEFQGQRKWLGGGFVLYETKMSQRADSISSASVPPNVSESKLVPGLIKVESSIPL
jgi:hypothetical protein